MNPDKPALEQAEALDALLREERVFRPLPQTLLAANVKPQELAEAVELARTNPLRYWEMAAEELEWHRRWDAVLDDREAPFYKWFVGAKLNIVHNALVLLVALRTG